MKKFLCLCLSALFIASAFGQDDPLKEYTGTYRFPDGSIVPSVEIRIEGGSLVAASQMGTAALEKLGKDTFAIVTYNGMLYFTRNSDNVVNGMKVVVQDVILEGKKDGLSLAMLRRNIIWTKSYHKETGHEGVRKNSGITS